MLTDNILPNNNKKISFKYDIINNISERFYCAFYCSCNYFCMFFLMIIKIICLFKIIAKVTVLK